MKYVFMTIALILSNYIMSQSNSIRVKYNVFATEGSLENNEKVKNSKVPEIYRGLDNALISLEYELDINNDRSHFFLIDGISINEKPTRIATLFSGKDEVYINKKENSFIKFKNYNGEKYYISYLPSKKWNISNESKKIEGFLCYKATIEVTKRIKKNLFKNHTIIAWFSPSIPFSFGPKEYCNLPGIILELVDDKITFLASKIELKVTDFKDLEVEKVKIISEEEFNEIIDLKTKSFFERLDKANE